MTKSVVHLNRYHHFTELMRDPRIEGELRRFPSRHDRSMQTTLRLQPAGRRSEKLFFFFHGMDGDAGDAVIVRELVHRQSATVVAMGGRGPCWVSSAFLADAEQVIGDCLQPFDDFHLIGVSMGGAQVLALPALLPEELRRSIAGVVALIPGANLPAIAATSSNERVRQTLLASVQGDLAVLEQRN